MHSGRAVPRSHRHIILGVVAVLCTGSACDVGGRGDGREGAEFSEGTNTSQIADSLADSVGQVVSASADTGKSATADTADGVEAAALDGNALADQAVRFVAGSTGQRVVVWSDSTLAADLQIQGTGAGDTEGTCRVAAPPGATVRPRTFPRGPVATLEVRADAEFTSGEAVVRCTPDPPMRITLVNAALMLAQEPSSRPPVEDPDDPGVVDLLSALALLASLGILVALWRLSKEIGGFSKSVTQAIKDRPLPEPVKVQASPEPGPDLTPVLGRIEQSLRGEAGEREKIVNGLSTLTQTVAEAGTALSAALASLPRIPPPSGSGDRESVGAAPRPVETSGVPSRLEHVFEDLYRNQSLVGEDGALKQEAARLKGLTDKVARVAMQLAHRLASSAADPRSAALEKELPRLRARCEQLVGRFSELQMNAGLTGFPVRAYIYPNHRDVRDVEKQVMVGLAESASLLRGQTDLLRKQFDQMVTEVLQPTLRAANYLRADDPEPDWLGTICKALGAEPFHPRAGEGIDDDLYEVLSGSPLAQISHVRAPAYMYNQQVLIPALVEMNGDG